MYVYMLAYTCSFHLICNRAYVCIFENIQESWGQTYKTLNYPAFFECLCNALDLQPALLLSPLAVKLGVTGL